MPLNSQEKKEKGTEETPTSSDLLLWLLQVNDSQFPSGAYAHSMGLEGYMQRGLVRKPEDLETFLERQIVPNLLHFELPYLLRAHQAASANDQPVLQALDHELDAWKLGAEMRTASRQLGNRRLAMLLKLDQDEFLQTYATHTPPCHHLIITAIELRNAPPATAACAFTYQTISGYTSASMKLIRLGQERCQGILRKTITQIAPHLQTLVDQPTDRIGWFNPTLEISSMRHARAHERLFIS